MKEQKKHSLFFFKPLSEKAYVEVFHTKDCFDYSSIVLYLIVFLVVLLGTLWSGRKFKLMYSLFSFIKFNFNIIYLNLFKLEINKL